MRLGVYNMEVSSANKNKITPGISGRLQLGEFGRFKMSIKNQKMLL
jgi:hypothetical protein